MSNPQIPLTGNIGAGGVFPLINSPSVVFATDANHTMSYPEMSGSSGFILVTSNVSLTATRNLIAPLVAGFMWAIENATTGGHSIQVIGSTGTGVTIPSGYTMPVYCDGTNYVTNPAASGGTVLGVTGTAPVASSGGTNPVISMAQANSTTNGWLLSTDWAAFNAKQAPLGYTPAHAGANSDITSLSGLTTPLLTSEGGTGGGGGTGYAYGNGSGAFTYSPSIPATAGVITLGGTLTSANVSFGTGAGTSPTLATIVGNDATFEITLTTGSVPAANQTILTVTFTASRGHGSYGIFAPQYDQYSSVAQIPSSNGGSPTSITLTSGTTALAASTSYTFSVFCP